MTLRSITLGLLLLPFAPFWGSITLNSYTNRFETKISWLFSDEKRLSSGKKKKTGFSGNEKTDSNWKKAPLLKKIEKIRSFFRKLPHLFPLQFMTKIHTFDLFAYYFFAIERVSRPFSSLARQFCTKCLNITNITVYDNISTFCHDWRKSLKYTLPNTNN